MTYKVTSTHRVHYIEMPNLEVNWKVVHKLPYGLKTFKATWADSIPAFILKAAADQLSQSPLYRYAKPRDQLERGPLTAQRFEDFQGNRVRLHIIVFILKAAADQLSPSSLHRYAKPRDQVERSP